MSGKWRWRHVKARCPIVKALKSVQGFKFFWCLFFFAILPSFYRLQQTMIEFKLSVTKSTPVWENKNKKFHKIFPTHVFAKTHRKLFRREQATDGGLYGAELSFEDNSRGYKNYMGSVFRIVDFHHWPGLSSTLSFAQFLAETRALSLQNKKMRKRTHRPTSIFQIKAALSQWTVFADCLFSFHANTFVPSFAIRLTFPPISSLNTVQQACICLSAVQSQIRTFCRPHTSHLQQSDKPQRDWWQQPDRKEGNSALPPLVAAQEKKRTSMKFTYRFV